MVNSMVYDNVYDDLSMYMMIFHDPTLKLSFLGRFAEECCDGFHGFCPHKLTPSSIIRLPQALEKLGRSSSRRERAGGALG